MILGPQVTTAPHFSLACPVLSSALAQHGKLHISDIMRGSCAKLSWLWSLSTGCPALIGQLISPQNTLVGPNNWWLGPLIDSSRSQVAMDDQFKSPLWLAAPWRHGYCYGQISLPGSLYYSYCEQRFCITVCMLRSWSLLSHYWSDWQVDRNALTLTRLPGALHYGFLHILLIPLLALWLLLFLTVVNYWEPRWLKLLL